MKRIVGARGLTVRLENVTSYERKRKNGTYKTVWRYREKGKKTIYLPDISDPNFLTAVDAARRGEKYKRRKEESFKPYTLGDLCHRFLHSQTFKNGRSEATQQNYAKIISVISHEYGHNKMTALKRKNVIQIRDDFSATPSRANRIVIILSLLCDYAIDLDWIERNPAKFVKKLSYTTVGHHTWTDEEIAKYLDAYGEGTKQRLAFYLLIFSAQRGSDVFRLGNQHRVEGGLSIKQQKTGHTQFIRLPDIVEREISLHPKSMTFITHPSGRPFASVKVFQQWFSKSATVIGLPHCSAHGLRKAASRINVENDGSMKGSQALLGHKTLSEAEKYAIAADSKRLVSKASEKIERHIMATRKTK